MNMDDVITNGVAMVQVRTRFGIKGSDAPALLQQLGIAIPTRPNSVVHWGSDAPFGSGRCLRQGNTEFLIELASFGIPAQLADHVLIRSDHSLLLTGAHWPQDLAQLCSFDFERLQQEPDLVVMTLLAGISVTLIREPAKSASDFALRLWCDPGFSVYLRQCLHSIRGSR
jgi:sarcosine oxidase, subunit gamma